MDAIRRLNPQNVLDLGCAETPIQDMNFKRYVGIDINPPSVNLSKFDRSEYTFLNRDYAEPLGFNKEFDLIIWSEGPEHTLKHKEVFNNIHKALTPDGFLLLTCPNALPDKTYDREGEHKCGFTIQTLKEIVTENNFMVLEATEIYARFTSKHHGYDWLYCLATNEKHDPRYYQYE